MASRAPLVATTILALLGAAASAQARNFAPPRFSPGPAPASLKSLVAATGGSASNAADASYAYLRKLDGGLQGLANDRLRGKSVIPGAAAQDIIVSPQGDVLVDAYVNGGLAAATAALRAVGMRVAAVNDRAPQRLVEGYLPAAALTRAAGLAEVKALSSIPAGGVNTGSVLSEGDAVHGAPAVRALGIIGTGVPVGVISDSINHVAPGVAGSQASLDLPPQSAAHGVHVLLDGTIGEDEGRAMAEIIYDEAPGITDMFFTTGGQGPAVRAAGIDTLVASGVKVIADDTFSISEPFFQDGQVAQAVDRAKAHGVAYVVSAGNRARQSWEGTFTPAGASNDFNPSAAVDTVQTLGTFTGTPTEPRHIFVALQWDEPFGHASTNLSLDLYSIVGGVPNLIATIDSDNIATGLPSEAHGISLPGTFTIGVGIHRVAGARNPYMKYIVGGTPAFNIAEYPTQSPTIDPDASSARGALTVAATRFSTPTTPEPFTSRGPAKRLFDAAGNRLAAPEIRIKPNLAAADGVATSVAGFEAFFGTSAAAPSAAGIVVLVRAARPAMPVDEVYAIMTNAANSVDCTASAAVPDLDCGSGFILANRAVLQALDPTPPTVSATILPATPDGAGGYYTHNVIVSWNVVDAGSPIGSRTGCGVITVKTNGLNTLTCSATSAGGTTTRSVSFKRDNTRPKLKITGIKAKKYTRSKLPRKSRIRCKASDPTSGIKKKCKFRGYSRRIGKHKLTFTATNRAGLTAKKKLTYIVKH